MVKKNLFGTKNLLTAGFLTAGVVTIAAFVLAPSTFMNLNFADAKQRAKCNNKYNPDLTPSKFTTNITNKYLALPAGRKLVYEGETEDGAERVEISIANPLETKMVMGITTVVYLDKTWIDADDDGKFEDNELHEVTKDYLAQRTDTKDVWYFGEDVEFYEDGVLVGNEGAWLAGVDGAKPGIVVKNDPMRNDSYLQECWRGEAEDTVDVVSLKANVRTEEFGRFKNCLKTYDYTPLDKESREHKFYCTVSKDGEDINAKVLQIDLESGDRLELVSFTDSGIENNTDTDQENDDDEDEDEDD